MIFDTAASIRNSNIDISIDSMKEKLTSLEESQINKEWFESEEALQIFKILFEKISFEQDKPKIKTLGELVTVMGLDIFKEDTNKEIVLNHLSKLTYVQINLLKTIASISPKTENFDNTGTALKFTYTGIFLNDIAEKLKDRLNKGTEFWIGNLDIIIVDPEKAVHY